MRKMASAALAAVLALILLASCALVLVPRALGYDCYAVTSGSMGDAYPAGTLLFAKPCPFEEVGIGDVLVFSDGSQTFTHRVVGKDEEKQWVTTKGDANALADPSPTAYTYARGRVAGSIPFAGYLRMLLHSMWGIVLVLLLALAFVIAEIHAGRRRDGHAKT